MTQRIAIIEDGTVTNIAVYPDGFVPDGVTTVLASPNVGKGWAFDGTSFTPPVPSPPAPESDEVQALRELATLVGPAAVAMINARFGVKP